MSTATKQRAFSLSKEEMDRRDALVVEYNASLEPIKVLIRAHNNGIHAEIQSFAEEVAGRLREEFDEKSEGWQGGEKGTAVKDWIEEWEELAEADELDEIEAEAGDTLEDISESAD
jgi:hypothetical protein